MRILITNWSLAKRGGTELYVRDLALALLKLGHTPIVYSPELGLVAGDLRDRTVPVVDDLAAIAVKPDVIHGHHCHETMTALLRFPGVPAIYVCHDFFSKTDVPPRFPRIMRFVAVDEACYDKLLFEAAVPEDRLRMLQSFVDLDRFQPRPHIRSQPQKVLLYCNYTNEGEHLRAAREVCARKGLTLDTLAETFGGRCDNPEATLLNYDIVLAKGRGALEALATGAAVIPYFQRCIGQMIKADDLPQLLPLNLGARAMTCTPDAAIFAQSLANEIDKYDPAEAARACERVRMECGRDRVVTEFVSLYQEAIAEHQQSPSSPDDEAVATATYVRQLLLNFKYEQQSFQRSRTYRLFESLLRLPLIGKMSLSVAEKVSGRKIRPR